MAYKTLTRPILLAHIMKSIREYESVQKYSRTLSLVFHVDSQKTANYICDEKFPSLCTQ